jgi:ribonuclease-3
MISFLKRLFKRAPGNAGAVSESGLQELEQKINYIFTNRVLLREAVTHRSYLSHNGAETGIAYERLEFLGDSVLGLVVAERLFVRYPEMSEGDLTKSKSMLVNKKSLAHAGSKIDLGNHVLMSVDEEKSGGRHRQSIVADCLEALIGAVYEDGGLMAARDLVQRLISFDFVRTGSQLGLRNYKGELLEYLQARGQDAPIYEVVNEQGPDHRKTFTVEASLSGRPVGSGTGESKKAAEQKAAREALAKFKS